MTDEEKRARAREAMRRYRKEHPEYFAMKQREYRQKHPDKYREQLAKMSAYNKKRAKEKRIMDSIAYLEAEGYKVTKEGNT